MRIVLFTLEETRFTPPLLEPVLRQYGSQIVAAYVSRKSVTSRYLFRRAWFFARNLYPVSIAPRDLWRFARRGPPPIRGTMLAHLRGYGLRAEYVTEIRSEAIRAKLAAHAADVFLFCPFDKIAGPKFLAIPRLGTFNTHLAKLPEYRGGLGAFWALRFGEREAGAAFHRAIPEVDAGELIAEVRFEVQTSSMQELMLETIRRAGPMVVEGLGNLASGRYEPINTRGRPVGYHMLPTRRDLKEFYRRRCRLI
jgi:folate-dependent phosphoribosylglycinamide formyltransferase PurN